MKISICDDDQSFIETMREMLKALVPQGQVSTFLSGFALLDFLTDPKNKPDVLILDMELPHINGLETGRELRLAYPNIAIIVVTDYPRYAVPSFDITPVHFLPKPVSMDALEVSLSRAKPLILMDYLCLKYKNNLLYVTLFEISSIESKGYRLKFTLEDGEFLVCQTLKYYDAKLKDKGFYRIRHNVIINLSKVKAVENGLVILQNGSAFQVARDRKQSFMDALLSWRHTYA